MRALLDINVLIALFDPDHTFHSRAHDWWAANQRHGWASCPLTENGFVRTLTNPSYSKNRQIYPADMIARLNTFAEQTDHQFWPDDISLRDKTLFKSEGILSSRLITDIYLLALATRHGGRLVTFDTNIPASAAFGASPSNLCLI